MCKNVDFIKYNNSSKIKNQMKISQLKTTNYPAIAKDEDRLVGLLFRKYLGFIDYFNPCSSLRAFPLFEGFYIFYMRD